MKIVVQMRVSSSLWTIYTFLEEIVRMTDSSFYKGIIFHEYRYIRICFKGPAGSKTRPDIRHLGVALLIAKQYQIPNAKQPKNIRISRLNLKLKRFRFFPESVSAFYGVFSGMIPEKGRKQTE